MSKKRLVAIGGILILVILTGVGSFFSGYNAGREVPKNVVI